VPRQNPKKKQQFPLLQKPLKFLQHVTIYIFFEVPINSKCTFFFSLHPLHFTEQHKKIFSFK